MQGKGHVKRWNIAKHQGIKNLKTFIEAFEE